ncbi:Mg(2+) transporter [Bordetella ansorpii]|uniref:Protein MgtC n=1 Tax=Bordetella ansorpii TaxID=288768 RepID=A0A157QJ58_9BORD|nr:MgtC/SapB family protein [Bordetella ansorpii]SAI45654.1 Mg(2+) transporter [Bordetella ansorpii]
MQGIWPEIWTTLRTEFSDVPDASEATRMVLRLLMAALLGGLLGYERERSGKSAGLRTHILVALGACLFVLAPLQAGMKINDLSRVMQGVIAGIGFLGAGAIIKFSDERRIRGLTTSAGIWLTAAIGITAGMGRETTAVFATLLALFVLHVLHRVEKRMDQRLHQHALIQTDSNRTDLPMRRSTADDDV